jgi:hypothetical protein
MTSVNSSNSAASDFVIRQLMIAAIDAHNNDDEEKAHELLQQIQVIRSNCPECTL